MARYSAHTVQLVSCDKTTLMLVQDQYLFLQVIPLFSLFGALQSTLNLLPHVASK